MKFKNPIIPGFHPDPSICRVGEDYYLVTSSFEYFPGVPVFHSRDLVNWEQIGHCLTRKSQLNLHQEPSSGGLFAPTLRYHDGTFYMVTTHTTKGGNFFVWSKDPAGEWSDPIWLEQGGIDPSLFFDDDGKVYLTSNGGGVRPGIYQCEINLQTGMQTTKSTLIWEGTGGAYPEGPHLYKINNLYYLFISEGGTEHGHMITAAKSERPYGPFEPCPRNPLLTHRSLGTPIKAVGHSDIIMIQDGSWWMVCLGIRPIPYPYKHHLGRETFLSPVVWQSDGWPLVGVDGVIHMEMEGPDLPQYLFDKKANRDDFDNTSLAFYWNFIRNPHPEDWSLSERNGWLSLKGSDITLNDVESPAFVCRRQEHFNCDVSVMLDFEPQQEAEEAGLTVFLNEKHHYEIAVTCLDAKRCIIFRRRIGSLWKIEYCEEILHDPLVLRIQADHEIYTFSYMFQNYQPVTIGKGECSYLSTEVGGKFTGTYFGMYATGNGIINKTTAYFDWFEYVPAEEQWI